MYQLGCHCNHSHVRCTSLQHWWYEDLNILQTSWSFWHSSYLFVVRYLVDINLVKLKWRYFHFLTKIHFVNYLNLVYSVPNHGRNRHFRQFSAEILSIHHRLWFYHIKPVLFSKCFGEFCTICLLFYQLVCVPSNHV